jgi:DNA-binding IclR family transcriptional regulator
MTVRDREAPAVKSAQRALRILELLTSQERGLTFGEIADALRYPRSSLHGLLWTMSDEGWLELDPTTRRYALGIRSWEAGNAYLRAMDLADRARPYMERVRDALEETVQLSVLDGRYNVYVAKVDGTQRLTLASAVGRRLEAHATGLGKVLLADLTQEELAARIGDEALERFTANTIIDPEDLRRELELIRRRGYALDEEEYTAGVRCVAVGVRDHSGRVTAAMSVSVPTVRFNRRRQQEAIALLIDAARNLSAALGAPALNPALAASQTQSSTRSSTSRV